MSGPAERFLDDLERHGTMERFLALVREHPDSLPSLVEGGLRRRLSSGASFLGHAISYLPASAVGPLAELAVRLYAPDETRSPQWESRSASETVLSQVALQFPRLLHPWLTELFEQEVNFDRYYAVRPWRESGERHHAYLLDVVRSGGSEERASRALRCLLETRTPAAFRAVEHHMSLRTHGIPWGAAAFDTELAYVGYERTHAGPAREGSGSAWSAASLLARLSRPEKEGWRRLYPETSYHLRFPAGYLPEYLPGKLAHPTFHLDAEDAVPARLGGAGAAECGVCGQPTHHLLTLDPVPAGLGVASVPALALETCFRCVWAVEELWWKHDQAGRPAPHPAQGGDPWDDVTAAPLLETAVRLVPTPARWYWQDANDERQNLTRLGGYPCWIQDPVYPDCPDCGETMAFLFQLDTGPPGDGGETFGDGILYTCWCDACRVSVSIPQGT